MTELTNSKINLDSLTTEQLNIIAKMVSMDNLKEEFKKREKIMNFDMQGIKKVWLGNKAIQTCKMYDYYLNAFISFLEKKSITIQDVNAKIADEFVLSIDGSSSAVHLATSAISSFYSTLLRYKEVDSNPFLGTNKMPRNIREKELHIPTDEDIAVMEDYLLAKVESSNKGVALGAKKMWVSLHLMKKYGLRIAALPTLTYNDSNRYRAFSKGKEIFGRINNGTIDLIKSLDFELSELNSNTLQNMFNKMVTTLYEDGRIKHKFHPHDFRHYFAIKEYRIDHDIYKVSKKLNHSSVSITQNYLRSLDIN